MFRARARTAASASAMAAVFPTNVTRATTHSHFQPMRPTMADAAGDVTLPTAANPMMLVAPPKPHPTKLSIITTTAAPETEPVVVVKSPPPQQQQQQQPQVKSPTKVESPFRRTPLHAFHEAKKAQFTEFAGYTMPASYATNPGGVSGEHLHTRSSAGLFDVSHMRQLSLVGPGAIPFAERVTVAMPSAMKDGASCLTLFPTEQATIIDDCILTRFGENHVGIVVNAGCAAKDINHLTAQLEAFRGGASASNGGNDVEMIVHEDRALLALQGPRAAESLARLGVNGLESLYFMGVRPKATIPALSSSLLPEGAATIYRQGYTGEDGFEISVPNAAAPALAEALCDLTDNSSSSSSTSIGAPIVRPIGLGARDTLRLEGNMNLYGQDISDETNILEAGLGWCVAKARKESGGFIGYEAFKHLWGNRKALVARKRVCLKYTGKGQCPRHGGAWHVYADAEGANKIGTVTSGAPSPSLNRTNIAIAYVDAAIADSTASPNLVRVGMEGGKKTFEAEVVKEFIPGDKYYKPAKKN